MFGIGHDFTAAGMVIPVNAQEDGPSSFLLPQFNVLLPFNYVSSSVGSPESETVLQFVLQLDYSPPGRLVPQAISPVLLSASRSSIALVPRGGDTAAIQVDLLPPTDLHPFVPNNLRPPALIDTSGYIRIDDNMGSCGNYKLSESSGISGAFHARLPTVTAFHAVRAVSGFSSPCIHLK